MGKNRFAEDSAALRRLFSSDLHLLQEDFTRALDLMVAALRDGNKIIAFGNGGSASDAEHLVGELVGRFGFDRAPLPGISLTGPSATFTAIANDYGYELSFARQIRGLGKPGDIAFGISTSGNSLNVLRAIEAAKELGITSIALTGARDSTILNAADLTLRTPTTQTARVQEIHALLIHSLCRGIEEEIFPAKVCRTLPVEKLVPMDQLENFTQALSTFHVVFTNGCFDLIHPGHLALLKASRALGDLLVVGLNADDSVRRLKGTSRPLHTFSERAALLAALETVDYIVGFVEDTPLELIRKLTPQVLVKGGDYSRGSIVGADWVESHGGIVNVFPTLGNHSTTRILQSSVPQRGISQETPGNHDSVPENVLENAPEGVPKDSLKDVPKDSLKDAPKDSPEDAPEDSPKCAPPHANAETQHPTVCARAGASRVSISCVDSGRVPPLPGKLRQKSEIIGVVPARLGSTRLPEKMLADLCGKPLVVRTAEAATASGAFSRVIVATDHERIMSAVRKAGMEAVMTPPDLPSGSARVAEVARNIQAPVFINIQGDEPLVDGEGIRRLIKAFDDPAVEMASLWFPLSPEDEQNPNAVKVVLDGAGNALYFSRSVIPHPRSRVNFKPMKHLGVYGYRRDTLLRLMGLPATDLEKIESLEQLRALYNGIKIRMVEAAQDSVGVDTQADLDRVRAAMRKRG